MIDAYKIGVSIAMTNGVSSVLSVIQKDMLGLKHDIDFTVGGFDRMKVAALGFGAIVGGSAVLGVMGKLVEAGKELVHQQALYKEAIRDTPGMTPDLMAKETADTTAQAWKTANDVITSNVAENLKSLRELRGVFGSDQEAREHLSTITKAASVMESVRGKGAGDQVFDMAKALEIKGVSMDPAHFDKMLDDMVKASVASGGKVLGSDFFGTFKYGRTATQGWDDKFVGQLLPTLIQEMKSGGGGGGSGGPGNALQSAFQAVVGGVMSNKAAGEFLKFKLLDPAKVIRTSTGNVKGIKPGGVVGAKEFQANPYQWVQDVLMPALKAKGITSPDAIRDEVSHMFVNRTAQQIITMFATMQARFEKDATQNRNAAGIGALDSLLITDPNTKIKAFNVAWENLMTALGAPTVDTATNLMMRLTGAMNEFTKWAVANPDLVRDIEVVAAGMAGLAVVLGAFAIGSAAASAIGLLTAPTGLLALAVGIEALGHATSAFPPWLVSILSDAAAGAAIGARFGGLPGAIAGAGLGAGLGAATSGADAAAKKLPDLNQRLKDADHSSYFNRYSKPAPKQPEQSLIQKQSYVPPPAERPVIQTIVYTQIDGKTIAKTVSREQAHAMSLPPAGRTGFDPRMTPSFPSNLVVV